MKLAVITAPDNFGLVAGMRLSYHLILAQYLNDPEYVKFFGKARLCGDYLMLDNGAAEFGASADFEQVVEWGDNLNVDEIVMPDVLDDMQATLNLTHDHLDLVDERRRMMVPQGKNWAEWTECLHEMVMMGCRTICVAKRYEALEGGRKKALQIIQDNGYHHSYDVHLLGCYRNPVVEVNQVRIIYPWVRGIDTAAPFAHAQNILRMNHSEHVAYDWGVPCDQNLALRNLIDLHTAVSLL